MLIQIYAKHDIEKRKQNIRKQNKLKNRNLNENRK